MKSRGQITRITLISIAVIAVLAFFLFSRADYHGKIGGLTESKFILYPLKINPEYEHATPEVHFTDNTEIVGKIKTTKSLIEGQEVKVWTEEIEGKIVAKKIKVMKDS